MTGVSDEYGAAVRWTDVDGVPVAWVDAEGPLAANLMFRVGKGDEQLYANGITHLIEHLALHPIGQVPHAHNGSVGTTFTSFVSSGDPAEVVAFLSAICRNLADLPIDRLEAERRVLAAERARRPPTVQQLLLGLRYGASGPGLWQYDEFASITAEPELLRTWSEAAFTRGNAVLVLSGPPPAGLSVPLPRGERVPVPPLREAMPRLPAWFAPGVTDAYALAVVRRSVAARVYGDALADELLRRLRLDQAIAYTPSTSYEPYDAETAFLSISADGHAEHLQRVVDTLLATVHELPDLVTLPDAVLGAQRRSADARSRPGAALAAAQREAESLLLTGVVHPTSEVVADIAALSAPDVADVGRAARASILYALPTGSVVPPDRAVPAPLWSSRPAVSGRKLRYLDAGRGTPTSMFLAGDGVTIRYGATRTSTVLFAECEACLAWDDGRRLLVGPDGLQVAFTADEWEDGEATLHTIDVATEHVRVEMPHEDPAPVAPPELPRRRIVGGSVRARHRGPSITALVVALLLLGGAIGLAVNQFVAGGRPAGVALPILVVLLLSSLLLRRGD